MKFSNPHLATPPFGFVVTRRSSRKRADAKTWVDLSEHSADYSDCSTSSTFIVESGTKPKSQRHVSFAPETFKTNKRKVRFASETENVIHESPFEYMDPDEFWYNAEELADIRVSVIELARQCHHSEALAWFKSLNNAYHDMKGTNKTSFLLTLFGQTENHNGKLEAWFLGLEQWILEKTMARNVRRLRMFERIKGWQGEDEITAEEKENQIRHSSEMASCVATKWAVYVGRRVAQSVQEEQ